MSEDWKNDRAEASMKEGTDAIQKAAAEKAKLEKLEAENKAWSEIAQELYVGDSLDDKNIDWVISELRQKYHLPVKK